MTVLPECEVEPGALKEVPRTLADRVTALESLLHPWKTEPEWTPGQVEEFRSEFAQLMETPGVRWLPPGRPLLTPETARALLSECVTVVKPGETLIIRAPESWTPQHVEYYQEYADAATGSGRISFPVLVVIGEELGVVRTEPDADLPQAGQDARPAP